MGCLSSFDRWACSFFVRNSYLLFCNTANLFLSLVFFGFMYDKYVSEFSHSSQECPWSGNKGTGAGPEASRAGQMVKTEPAVQGITSCGNGGLPTGTWNCQVPRYEDQEWLRPSPNSPGHAAAPLDSPMVSEPGEQVGVQGLWSESVG